MATAALIAAKKAAKQRKERAFRVSRQIKVTGLKAVETRRQKLNLDMRDVQYELTGSNKRTLVMGTDPVAVVSMKAYNGVWSGLCNFCWLIGDYDSAMMLDRANCPKDPPTVATETLILYLRFRVYPANSYLTQHGTDHMGDSAPRVKNVNGEYILCRGDWNSVPTVKLLRTGVTKLLSHYDNGKLPYVAACDDCRKQPVELGVGCHKHSSNPRFYPVGNACNTPEFRRVHIMYQHYAKQMYDAERTSFAFLPSEVRDIRSWCMMQDDPYYFMIWTIMIVGIKQFRRIEEILQLGIDEFDDNYAVVTENNVEALAVWVYGKSDNDKIHLLLWDETEYPEFSPTRAVLAWMHMSGIRSGRLFPPKDQIGTTASPTESLSYAIYRDEIIFFCKDVLKKDLGSPAMEKMLIGTHVLRKTGYLFAFWGFQQATNSYEMRELSTLDKSSIMQSARHSDKSDCVHTYLADAATLMELVGTVAKDDPKYKVGRWKSIHLKTHAAFLSITLENKKYLKPLRDLVDWYVSEKLQLPLDGMFPPRRMAEKLMMYRPTLPTRDSFDYRELLRHEVPAARLDFIVMAIDNAVRKAAEDEVRRLLELSELSMPEPQRGSVAGAPAAAATRTLVTRPSGSLAAAADTSSTITDAVVDSDNFQERAANRKLPKDALIELLKEVVEDVATQIDGGRKLVQPYSTFVYSARKTVTCLEAHSKGDVAEFLKTHSRYARAKFKCDLCEAAKKK
jgi:hypothetical protein